MTDDNDEPGFNLGTTYRVSPDTILAAMTAEDPEPDDIEQEWLFEALEDLAEEALTEDIHPSVLASAITAFNAAWRSRITAAMNLAGRDSPYGTLSQEFDKGSRIPMEYHRFMTAMDELEDGPRMMAMNPGDLPPDLREKLEESIEGMGADSDPEGMFT